MELAEITIQKYENDERKPSIDMVERLASALNVSPLELLNSSEPLSSIDNMYINTVIKSLISLSKSPDDSTSTLARTLELTISKQ